MVWRNDRIYESGGGAVIKRRISVDKIRIPYTFLVHPPKPWKLREKLNYFTTNGEFRSKIVIDHNNTLIDGYTSYLICRLLEIRRVNVEILK